MSDNNSAPGGRSELGKQTEYDTEYNPDRLFPISREDKRIELGIKINALPFVGVDVWNHYEVSWLNNKGKPVVAMARIAYDCTSPMIVESKSLKLYFNSLNHSKFDSMAAVEALVENDLQKVIGAAVNVQMKSLSDKTQLAICNHFSGESLDDLDIDCSVYIVEPSFLMTTDEDAEETLYSDLLKSNCLVTHQPDWGSVQISYKGKKIDRAGLLRYIVSFRNHNEFHEQCIERIFVDIMKYCQPESLTIQGRYTRRGGIDINPFRSTEAVSQSADGRLVRQ